MLIDNDLLDRLLKEAGRSERLRMNLDMRTSGEDGSQRMLNALLPGTVMPIHRHRHSAESVVILRGDMSEIFYDDNGVECCRYRLNPSNGVFGVQIPLGQWHSVEVHEPTVIFESKDGAYEPITSEDLLING